MFLHDTTPAASAEPRPAAQQDRPLAALQPYTETVPGSLVEFEMVPVPGGDGVEPFFIGKHEVMWDEFAYWAYVRDLEKEIDKIKQRARKLRPSPPYDQVDRGFGFTDRPALGMSRLSAELYAEWLSEKTGRKYRLPTKQEWQHAFKEGYGSLEVPASELPKVAWFADNAEDRTHEPGSREANKIGVHDMLGNVAEWVTETGEERMAMGGHFLAPADQVSGTAAVVEDASWNENYPNEPKSIWWFVDAPYVGFRLVCEPEVEAEPAAGADAPPVAGEAKN